MSQFLPYLNKPASYNTKPWVVVVVASVLVCFLLGFFQPFGIDKFSVHIKCFIVAGYTLVTTISTSVVGYLLPRIFKAFYDPPKWTIGKRLINNILIISLIVLGNSIFEWSIGQHLSGEFGYVLLSYMLVTPLIGIIPALVSIFIVQNYALKKNLHDVKIMNDKLAERLQNAIPSKRVETDVVILSGETKETITVYPDCILYLESSGNYIKVNYLSDGVVKQKQIRNTISQMTDQLLRFPYLVRCHRAYMVNISYITNIEGNAQGYETDCLWSINRFASGYAPDKE